MFKCAESYCIRWSYVCDEKWNCPEGDDENSNPMCTKDYVCISMYKCRNITQKCLHVGNVCDWNKECPCGDDELFCDFKNAKCPSKCICLFQTISCINAPYLLIDPEISFLYLSVYISHSNIYLLNELHDTLKMSLLPRFQGTA